MGIMVLNQLSQLLSQALLTVHHVNVALRGPAVGYCNCKLHYFLRIKKLECHTPAEHRWSAYSPIIDHWACS